MRSAYKVGWVGLRVSKSGRSSKILKADGWLKLDAADLNNRNAFNWIRPVRTNDQFNSTDWTELAKARLVGIAVWITDAQWIQNSGITDKQWRDRRIVEFDFNSKWPTGQRNEKTNPMNPQSKHTPGKWHINAGSTNGKTDHQIYSDKDNRTIIAQVIHRDGLLKPEIDANARPIAGSDK